MSARSRIVAVIAAVLLAVGVGPRAWAWWNDAASGTGTLGAATVPTTTLSCGALGVLSVTFNWTAVPNATSYTLHYGSQAITTTATTATVTTVISGGTASVDVNRDFGSTTWTSAGSNTRTFTVAVVSLCA